ncbi:hypothetical protein CPLU01_01908 [Colletotrichum plurivorum]|uniref:Uncharacterized protein n=1 Tax=Colletotrichum plurivorum TaxID=2175906 RepID=A0A8H6KY96_9PEZI|nr:hypothetical protein CPLU01_01908 [Colletotrichum plurivorum]
MEKGITKAITLVDGWLHMVEAQLGRDGNNHWYCVERDGYFGFQNPASGTYLGHDGNHVIHAKQYHLEAWERFTPRRHPDGGYQLLSPWFHQVLQVLCVAGDGQNLVRRNHGITRWEFVAVSP